MTDDASADAVDPARKPPTTASERSETAAGTGSALWDALASESIGRDRALARSGQLISGAGLLLAVLGFFLLPRLLAIASTALAAATLSYFTLRRAAIEHPGLNRLMTVLNPLALLSIPLSLLVIIAVAQGPRLALGSWIPPEMLIGFICFSILRLNPIYPLILGVGGGLAYYVFWLVVSADASPADMADELYRPGLHIFRAVTFVAVGVTAALATRGVRRTLDRAARSARQQDLFGKYRLGREIAKGGMGTVVKATYCPEGGFERRVAIKRIHPHLASDPKFVERFRQEAALCARLLHPNIVSVFDFGKIDDTYFLAMEYVDGLSLAALVDRARLQGRSVPPGVAGQILLDVLDGLTFAHEVARDSDGQRLRVVHRDLSPANVLVGRAGQVKVLDFGIAKALRDGAAHQTKHLTGNFAYMSPEQASGKPFDERADLFSAGALLWELLCGRPLFLRQEPSATLLAVIGERVPSVRRSRSELHVEWDQLLDRALAKRLEDRFVTARAMAAEVKRLMALEGIPAPDAVRAFVQETLRLPIPTKRVESSKPFRAHDAVTAVPEPPTDPREPELTAETMVESPARDAESGEVTLPRRASPEVEPPPEEPTDRVAASDTLIDG